MVTQLCNWIKLHHLVDSQLKISFGLIISHFHRLVPFLLLIKPFWFAHKLYNRVNCLTWLSIWGSVVRVGRPITGRLADRLSLSPLKKIGELTAGGVAVHLLATAEVPLSKAPYPHAPQVLWMAAHRSSVWHLSPLVCDPVHVCVQQVPTWMG